MNWTKYISVLALFVSIGSFGLSYNLSRESAVTAIKPVLVFQFDDEKGWSVQNVGNGPALDIIVAMKKDDNADWSQPMRIPPLARNGTFSLKKWDAYTNARTLGVRYRNIQEKIYSTTCTNDLSKTHQSNVLPSWPDKEIQRHWKS